MRLPFTLLALSLLAVALSRAGPTPPTKRLPLPYHGPVIVKLSQPATERMVRLLARALKSRGVPTPEDRRFVLFARGRLEGLSPSAQKRLGVEYVEKVSPVNFVPVLDVAEVTAP